MLVSAHTASNDVNAHTAHNMRRPCVCVLDGKKRRNGTGRSGADGKNIGRYVEAVHRKMLSWYRSGRVASAQTLLLGVPISKKMKTDPSAPIGSFTPVRGEVIFCSRKDLEKKKLFIFS